MAQAPLLPGPGGQRKAKASMFYDADQYIGKLEQQFVNDHEIAALMNAAPDEDPNASKHQDNFHKVDLNDENRSKLTGRLFPQSNKPNPMPEDLKFMFTRISPEQGLYMWKFLTGVFILQCVMVVLYAIALSRWGDEQWTLITVIFGVPFAYIAIQHIYVDHDVMHGATFPPYWWQQYITHPFSDFISIPWSEFIIEHMKHHSSTVDLLLQGEFGWDPEMPLYWLMDTTKGPVFDENGNKKKDADGEVIMKPKNRFWPLTIWLIPVVHFFGLNDTGGLFCLEWYMHFPEANGDKCNKEFWTKWFPRRVKHQVWVALLWYCVYLLGEVCTGRGLQFMLCVSCCARCGYGSAWMFITNFTHSHQWNEFLKNDPDRSWPVLHSIMAFVLGGRHRWNEMLFHDVHHAFPNAVGTLSQRGRFNGWEKVHDAAVLILHRGIFKPNGDEETKMQQTQKRRSQIMVSRIEEKKALATLRSKETSSTP